MLTEGEPQWLTEEVKTGVSKATSSTPPRPVCCASPSSLHTHYFNGACRRPSSPSSSTAASCWDPTPESRRGESVHAHRTCSSGNQNCLSLCLTPYTYIRLNTLLYIKKKFKLGCISAQQNPEVNRESFNT